MKEKNLLTFQECRLIVEKHLQSNLFEITQYEEKPLPEYPGKLTSDFSSVKIEISYAGTTYDLKCIVKKIGTTPQLQVYNFSKEIYTHEILFEALKQNYPEFDVSFTSKCYFTKDNSLIVFEDPFEQDFVLPKKSVMLDTDHIKLTLGAIAKYHAAYIALAESKHSNNSLQVTDQFSVVQNNASWIKSEIVSLNKTIENLGLDQEEKVILKEKLYEVDDYVNNINSKSVLHNTLCHGYMWGNNMLFKYNSRNKPIECKLLNFELQHYGPPALDVLQFIYNVTTLEMRKEHLHMFFEHYCDRLTDDLSRLGLNMDKAALLKDFELSVHHLLPLIKIQTAHFRQIYCENFEKWIAESVVDIKNMIKYSRLTMEDCFKIIEGKLTTTDYEFINYELKPLGHIGGYLGDHNKLKIAVHVNNEKKILNMFAKLFPIRNVAISLANDMDAYPKEIFMYQDLIPKIKQCGINIIEKCVIPCYFARYNDVLIFDDLEFISYKTMDPRQPYTYDVLKIIVKKLADFHSSSIILEEKLSKQTKTKYRLNNFYSKELSENLILQQQNHRGSSCFEAGINMVIFLLELFFGADSMDIVFKKKVEKAYDSVFKLIKASDEFRNVICHGDLWTTNILVQFKDDKPIDCRLIDFQLCRYCPPAQDLLTCLYLTTDRSTRKQYWSQLINSYYQEFAKNITDFGYDIEQIYSYDTFVKSIEYMTPEAVCQTVVYFQLTILNPDIIKEHITNDEGYENVLLGDRREFILDMFNRDPLFKERMVEALLDLKEMCTKYY